MDKLECDYLIIGAGIIGLNIANELIQRNKELEIIILEKEEDVACHSSGRNSGVLHAGFYYTADSLKAKFTRDGNRLLTEYCEEHNLKINKCQKVVVAYSEEELKSLEELYKRGLKNGVDVRLISEEAVDNMFPNVKTYKKALFSPNTSTVDPTEICHSYKTRLIKKGVKFLFKEAFLNKNNENEILTSLNNSIKTRSKVINCAGLYADKIAKEYGYSKDYVILPFKGVYLKYGNKDQLINTNIYPVPNLKNPFLGVHYTVTVDNIIKIGPTAIPAFWRENYSGMSNFKLEEFLDVVKYELKLFISNKFNFRALAIEEMKKYSKSFFVGLALKMVKKVEKNAFKEWSKPGIRAQLLNTKTLELVQDFIVEGDDKSIHVLNAVSPAFTCSIPFSKWIVDNYIDKKVINERN